jgi:hypothetical protein
VNFEILLFLPEFFDSQFETFAGNYFVRPDQSQDYRFLLGFAPVRVTMGRNFEEVSIGVNQDVFSSLYTYTQ